MNTEQAEDDAEEMSAEDEADMNRFFKRLALSTRVSVARKLLSGNDTGCFSTEQYRIAYEAQTPMGGITSEQLWFYITPESHLRSIPQAVREVAPGVWAAAN